MTRLLLKKEFVLSMHPTVPIMLLLGVMAIIPNYPYLVMYFYVTLSLFFTCLNARENNDTVYTLSLPVKKTDIVKSRLLFACIVELISLAVTVPFILLSAKIAPQGNAAGMDANLVLLGQGFVLFGLFNLVFFTSYYKDVSKVGVPFVKASVVSFILVAVDVCLCYAFPMVRDVLDTPGFSFLKEKAVCLALGAAVYAVLTLITFKISAKRMLIQDVK
ncbi:MAG: ABC-2 transporter permease [Acutalibacteraceae bacterium]